MAGAGGRPERTKANQNFADYVADEASGEQQVENVRDWVPFWVLRFVFVDVVDIPITS